MRLVSKSTASNEMLSRNAVRASAAALLVMGFGPFSLMASAQTFTRTDVEKNVAANEVGAAAASSPETKKNAAKKPDLAKKSSVKDNSAGEPKVSDKKPTTPNATASIVNVLVEKGILTEEQAAQITQQVDDETYVAREATKDATDKAADAAKAAKDAALAASPPGTKHVAYVPEVVKRQLRDELRQEVMAQAQRENWASPGKYPEWASRIRIYGDIRARYEGIFYPDGNKDGSYFPNFNAINTGSPYDISSYTTTPYPKYDTDQDRNRFRLRARLGVNADLPDGFVAGLRVATGDSNTPVSTNQTFGGSGGNFSKYSLWLDRAFISYRPNDELVLSIGRFDNPFFAPSELVWDSDLGFDGFAIQAKRQVSPSLTPFFVAGAFPIFNTDLNFATNQDYKFSSTDKYLLGAQVGLGWRANNNISVKAAVAYYDFENVKGEVSSPCIVLNASSACGTDSTRPSFAQKGNTYTPLRNIVPTTDNNFGKTNQFQYFGLASDFQDLVVTAQVDLAHFNPIHVIFDGEYVENFAFNRGRIADNGVVNNFGPGLGTIHDSFDGGNIGWLARLTVGHTELAKFGDWNANAGYKYLESDAVVDAFVDSDFGLGGTNLKGYFVGGNFALNSKVSTTVRAMSANSIAGPTYDVDIVQADLNAKF
jgi:hypothetical protein